MSAGDEALAIALRALVAVVVEPAKGRRLAIADAADRRLRPLLVRAREEAEATSMLSTLVVGPR